MCSNTFVSEMKEIFTSTHKYLMNTLLNILVIGTSKSCGNNSTMSNWLSHNFLWLLQISSAPNKLALGTLTYFYK